MFSPRWKKVLGDLRGNPMRTVLVVLSIFIGVFSVGLITSSQEVIQREMRAAYVNAQPAHATLSVPDEDSFGDDLLQAVRHMDEVGEAEARRVYSAQVRVRLNDWYAIQFIAIEDYDDVRIDQFSTLRGAEEPGDKEILIERSALSLLPVEAGDEILIERPDGKQRVLRVAGIVYAPTAIPATFGNITGYVDFETIEWLSGEQNFNQLLIRSAENGDDQTHNEAVADAVYEKVRKAERSPSFPQVPPPNQHPLEDFIGGMVAIMSIMGVLSVFLGGFLVTNTISALLAQQIKQIGIMKSVGARAGQIIGMYLVLVLCFGLIALLLAYPAVQFSTRAFAQLVAEQFNLEINNFSVPPYVWIMQLVISLLMPMVAALFPIISGTRVTIREALSSEGGGNYGRNFFDRLIQHIRGLPRPLLLSLRNTFRRKARVSLTLVTLTLGGAIFISIFSVRNSLLLTVSDLLDSLFNFSVQVTLERDYRDDYVINQALSVPGVVEAETWRQTAVRRVLPDNAESESIVMWAVPPESEMVSPQLLAGRWLLPEDENAIVVSNGVLQEEDDLAIGDEILLNIRGREIPWRIVGEVSTIGGARWAYVSYDAYGRAAREVGAAGVLLVRTQPDTSAVQAEVATALDEHLSSLGINVTSTETNANIRAQNETFFNGVVAVLLALAVLIAIVGGLGLAGTMSLNVLERIREIGVMRAIGASDMAVLQIVVVEGMVLGFLSWLLAALLSFPMSILFSEQVGMQLFSFPLTFSFSVAGAIWWLVLSLVLAAVASFLPAWNASRVTVRDVLAYE